MNLLNMIGFGNQGQTPSSELPDIYSFACVESEFIETDILNIYARILTDCLERTHGLPDDAMPLFWDNCLASESKDGLVSLLSKAMYKKQELFLIYDKSVKVIRKASASEEAIIKSDYEKAGSSKVGFYITFKNYNKTDMLKIYSALEYYTLSGLHKQSNLSRAIQLKISELRSTVGVTDASLAIKQAQDIATGLKNGKDVLLDSKDSIETSKPDLTSTQASVDFINQKRSFYLGLPASWITGLAPKGLGDSGEGEAKSVERGLKAYYFAIIKPVVESIFVTKVTFKTENIYSLQTGLEALKTFELVESEDLLNAEQKKEIIAKLFGLSAERSKV